MLEKIGTSGFETLSSPDTVVLDRLTDVLSRETAPIVYEVGIGIGATSIEIMKLLDGKGCLHLFSREMDVTELAQDLRRLGYLNVGQWGSPGKVYSGYHFELAEGFAMGRLPQFDLAYLDGGHVMHLDGTAICILKELAKPGGYLILDDISWSLAQSPTQCPEKRPRTAMEYDQRQIEACHVDLARRCFLDTDPRFTLLEETRNSAVYQRAPEGGTTRATTVSEAKATPSGSARAVAAKPKSEPARKPAPEPSSQKVGA